MSRCHGRHRVAVYVGGPTATFIDLGDLLASRLLPFIAVVLAIGCVLLLIVFRSVAIPLTTAVLNLLSTDYQVFLLSRTKEEWGTHHGNARAGHDGISRVSGVITGAAIIMIAVFGSFVVGGQRLLQEFGVAFAVAVALDAFLIRFALVPAFMCILGDRNRQLPSGLPRMQIEDGAVAPCADQPCLAMLGEQPAGTPSGDPSGGRPVWPAKP